MSSWPGAEPSLVPELLDVCFAEMPLGCIATNGVRRIDPAVGYKIHISVWGNDATSLRVRKARDLLGRQIENYRGDPRAVFVYTFTRENIDEAAGRRGHPGGRGLPGHLQRLFRAGRLRGTAASRRGLPGPDAGGRWGR